MDLAGLAQDDHERKRGSNTVPWAIAYNEYSYEPT